MYLEQVALVDWMKPAITDVQMLIADEQITGCAFGYEPVHGWF